MGRDDADDVVAGEGLAAGDGPPRPYRLQQERRQPEIIGGSRRRRIARGSGCTPQDVNELLNQFRQMQKLMRQMASGKGLQSLARMIR